MDDEKIRPNGSFDIFDLARKEGRQEGRQEGQAEAFYRLLQRQLTHGDLSADSAVITVAEWRAEGLIDESIEAELRRRIG